MAEQLTDRGVLPGRDAQGEQHLLGRQQPGQAAPLVGDIGQQAGDEERRHLRAACPLGVPSGAALDAAVRGVRGRGVDAGELERPAVDPGPVAVLVREEHRAVGHDRVQRLAGRGAAGVVRHPPAATDDPLELGVSGGVRRDPRQGLVGGHGVVQVAAQQVDAAHDRVDVGVLEAGDQQPAVEVDDLGRGADELAQLVVGPHGGDASAAHGDACGHGLRRRGGEDPPVHEERVGRAAHIVFSSDSGPPGWVDSRRSARHQVNGVDLVSLRLRRSRDLTRGRAASPDETHRRAT